MKELEVFKEVAEYLGGQYGFKLVETSPKKFMLKKDDKEITFGPGVKSNNIAFKWYDVEDEDDMISYAEDIIATVTGNLTTEYSVDGEYVLDKQQAENSGYILCTTDDVFCLTDKRDVIENIDTRAYNISDIVLDEFWSYQFDEMCVDINDVAETISVYTYKGKNFYITPKLEEIDFEYGYLVDGEIEWGLTTRMFSKDVNNTEVQKVINIIKETKLNLERASAPELFIYTFKSDSYLYEILDDFVDVEDYVEEMEDIIQAEICDKQLPIENDVTVNWFTLLLEDRCIDIKDGELYFFGDKILDVNNHRFMDFINKCELEVKRTKLRSNIELQFNAFIHKDEKEFKSWFEVLENIARSIHFSKAKEKGAITVIKPNELFKVKGLRVIRGIREKLIKKIIDNIVSIPSNRVIS